MKEPGKAILTTGEKECTAGEKECTAGNNTLSIRSYDFTASSLNITLADFTEKLSRGKNESEVFAEEIEQVIALAATFLQPKAAYRIINRSSPDVDSQKQEVPDLHLGALLSTKLLETEKIAVFVCTAGAEAGELYGSYLKQGDNIKAFFADLLGTIAVEKPWSSFTGSWKKNASVRIYMRAMPSARAIAAGH